MKKIALISSFCDTEEKLNVLEKNIKTIKLFGLDVLLITPFSLPKTITDICEYVFQTKDNPVYDWPLKAMYYWREIIHNGKTYRIAKTVADYGWASLYQIKQLSEIALTLNYDYFYHIIYDLKINQEVEGVLKQTFDKLVFPSKRGDTIWPAGLHLNIFNRQNLKIFKTLITEESYLGLKDKHAFDWIEKVSQIMPLPIADFAVEDEIYYYDGFDFFNSSNINGIKYFINKNDETQESIKLLFYEVMIPQRIKIISNGEETLYDVNNFTLIDLGFNKYDMREVTMEINGNEVNITNEIMKIKHSDLKIY